MDRRYIGRILLTVLTVCILLATIYVHKKMEAEIENLTIEIIELEELLNKTTDIKLVIEKSYYNPLKTRGDYYNEPQVDIYYLQRDEALALKKYSEIVATGIKVNLYPLNNITNAYKLVSFLLKLRIKYPYDAYSWAIFKYKDNLVFFRLEMVNEKVIQACIRIYSS